MSTGYGFEIAIRDIEAGEEVTDEYGMFNFEYSLQLSCRKSNCRGTVNGNDIEDYYAEWDRTVKSALRYFQEVRQPLRPFLNQKTLQNLINYLESGKGYQSILNLKFDGELKPS